MTARVARNGAHAAARPERTPFRLGVFTRLVDRVDPAEVYARGFSLFTTAEELGFDVGWVAQHHAHKEGGLPAPLVFLGYVAARTERLRLATGIITLPLEHPMRLAEDAAVLDVLSDGRLELGFGTGGNDVVFSIFERQLANRQADYEHAFAIVRDALSGKPLVPDGPVLWPNAERLSSSIWEAAMSVPAAVRAGEHRTRLLLARTAVRPTLSAGVALNQRQSLGDAQTPLVEAFLSHWTSTDQTPRIGLSRSIYVAETRAAALADAEAGIRRFAQVAANNRPGFDNARNLSLEELLALADVHIGSPAEVIASLRADPLLSIATDLILQVHPVDPSHAQTLRSLRLIATEVAPALGWRPARSPKGEVACPSNSSG
ncbi:MAG TPA: LLM class flavin-dependent oxidoreductase [Chloroflexota bacterium]|nr:LLM class flavin-dependent oxidoreductase [Chloroflexota bacterium]